MEAPLPGHWQPFLCPRNPFRTDMSPPFSETDFQLGDHQQLRGYFLDGSRDRLR